MEIKFVVARRFRKWSKSKLFPTVVLFVALVVIWMNMATDDSSVLTLQQVPLERESADGIVAPRSDVSIQQHSAKKPTLESKPTPEHTKRIPNILIAGAQKASTSSIATYIKDKIGVCFSDPSFNLMDGKEAHFFDYPRSYRGGLSVYQDKYAYCKPDQQLLDGTPDTMVYADLVKNIFDQNGSTKDLKVVFILREPVSREISRYNHQLRLALSPNPSTGWGKQIMKRNGTIKSFMEDAEVQILRPIATQSLDKQKSAYAHHLRRWFALFDREQILVLSYDELKSNQTRFLQRLHEFLNIPIGNATSMVLPYKNTNKEQTMPPPCTDQMAVARQFEALNEDLYRLLEQYPGPNMEQRPFPRFQPPCGNVAAITV
jgi:Sulfotransferase domain